MQLNLNSIIISRQSHVCIKAWDPNLSLKSGETRLLRAMSVIVGQGLIREGCSHKTLAKINSCKFEKTVEWDMRMPGDFPHVLVPNQDGATLSPAQVKLSKCPSDHSVTPYSSSNLPLQILFWAFGWCKPTCLWFWSDVFTFQHTKLQAFPWGGSTGRAGGKDSGPARAQGHSSHLLPSLPSRWWPSLCSTHSSSYYSQIKHRHAIIVGSLKQLLIFCRWTPQSRFLV